MWMEFDHGNDKVKLELLKGHPALEIEDNRKLHKIILDE